ncbi:MAG: 4-hydroxy-tetrahydrodipicolinate reductase, partial [Pseudomonadota bacterium]
MTTHLNIAIAGSAGRMGRQLIGAAIDAGHKVTGGSEAPGSDQIGKDLGALGGEEPTGTLVTSDVAAAAETADVWIDFTVPAATLAALSTTSAPAFVIGTTGFSEAEEQQIKAASASAAIVKAGNFSLGVNLLEALVKQAASRLGAEWDIEVLETHHRHKVDAPSGTALMLGEAAAAGRAAPLSEIRAAPY